MTHTSLTRRRFLTAAGLAASAATVDLTLGGSPAQAAGYLRWSDPATWGGKVPDAGAAVEVQRPVLLDVDVVVAELRVVPGAALSFDPAASRTLTSRGNVHVEGLLQMRPGSAAVQHRLEFVGIDEHLFVGGGMGVVGTDVGLWVTGVGVLDLAGASKTAWVRAALDIPAGARTITLAQAPVGWQVGDELAITPTAETTVLNNWDTYDTATITGIAGAVVTLAGPTRFSHPRAVVGPGMLLGAEVLNLTRNVNVSGTASGRAHVMVTSSRAQSLSYYETRWVGPRHADGKFTKSVLGRYGLHIHMAEDGSRGTQVTGVVVRDAGSRAFVPHGSNGITFRSCISHNTMDEAYWWDGAVDTRTAGAPSHDIVFSHCVASRVSVDPPFRGYRLSGFVLGLGTGNVVTECVAVGVQGNGDASGFHWPESPKTDVWSFHHNVAHNNKRNGIFTWQNTDKAHVVSDFLAYNNGGSGIAHGAYINNYLYANCFLVGNAVSGVDLHSHSHVGTGQRFVGLHIDGRGRSRHAVQLLRHSLNAVGPTRFERCTFTGYTVSAVASVYDGRNGASSPERLDLVDCASSGVPLSMRDNTVLGSRVRVQQGAGAYVARPLREAGDGSAVPAWGVMVAPTEPFTTPSGSTAMPFKVAPASPAPATTGTPGLLLSGVPTSRISVHGTAPQVEAVLRRQGADHVITFRNRGNSACTIKVRQGRATSGTQLVPPGTSIVRLPVVRAARSIEVRCHDGATLRWPLR